MKLRVLILFFSIGAVVMAPASAVLPEAQEVVVYTSIDDVFARPVMADFEKRTGIKVKLVPDTEETKSTGLLNRLIAEKNRPQADVFWSGDPIRAAILKQKGISTSYKSPEAKGLPKLYSDSEGYWTGFSARARVLLYNTNLIKKTQAPTSILDLAKSEFKSKGCIANPLFGTTSMHATALFQVLGDKKARSFFLAMTENGVQVVSSNGEIRRRVASGDCAFGVTDTDDAYQAVREKKPVEVVYPDKDGMGTLVVPNAVVLIKNAPHPQAGKKLIDYLLTPEVEKMLAESEAAQLPVRPSVLAPPHVRPLSSITPMQVDYGKLAEKLDELSRGFLKEWASKQN